MSEEIVNAYIAAVQWIKNMLLCDEIRLKDVPQAVRISSRGIYVTAFRISNKLSCKRFIQDLNILCRDIYELSAKNPCKSVLVNTLSNYLNINDHKEDEEFVDFKKNIYEEVLRELRRSEETAQKNLRNQFEEYHIRDEE